MAFLVQKFGGTSVADSKRIKSVADQLIKAHEKGHKLVVVLSAMSGETDRLINLAQELSPEPDDREYATVISTGEQVSVGLLAMHLIARGLKARSLTGLQACILTDDKYKKARILHIDSKPIEALLNQGYIVIVAGFQGVDKDGNISTLGRGGSDTTAVALAAALKADECQIFTDVDGVYTADPRMVPQARRLKHITCEEMLELASLGAKVLQTRSVEFIGKYQVNLRVLSSFVEGEGTLITYEEASMEQPVVSGIAFNRNEAKLTIKGVPDKIGTPAQILGPIGEAGIDIDMIIQNIATDGTTDFTFTVNREDYLRAFAILETVRADLGAKGLQGDQKIAKISLVGVGMRSHAGVAQKMFTILAEKGIKLLLISTSEIKISVVVDEKTLELAVRSLHSGFQLEVEPNEEFDPLPLQQEIM